MKNHITALVVSVISVTAAQEAQALGFGRVVPSATLGQTLDVTVPVRVDSGERFGSDCVQVDVLFGEVKLLPSQILTAVSAGRASGEYLVRVRTTNPIEEPVVEVGLSAGCERRFTRRFTAFADPPMVSSSALPISQGAPTAGSQSAASADPDAASPTGRARGSASGRNGATGGHAASGQARKDHVQRGPTRVAAEANSRGAGLRGAAGGMPGAGGRRSEAGQSRLLLDSGFAHLKLDMEDPIIPVARVAGGASGAMMALSDLEEDADARRLQQLEQSLQTLKKETQVSRDRSEKLQARLNEAESRNEWLPWLLGLLGLSVLAVAGLGWRLRQQSKEAQSSWYKDSPPAPAPAPTAVQLAAATVRSVPPPVDAGPSIAGELVDSPAAPEGTGSPGGVVTTDAMSATQPLNRAALAGMINAQDAPSTARELSVEELLDLEQQADFFIALGQEDAAVDLLMSHLRSVGGQSPLPYTKLLEIYRRQGDRSAYERTRARFNRRFNAYAPDWDTGPGAGRTLEDYPETIGQIQAAWGSPIDAMAILEALLFKRDDTSELFDLPAYRDVLVLYSLARDLWNQSGGAATSTPVDVLLPLDDAEPVSIPSLSLVPNTPTSTAESAPGEAGAAGPGAFELTSFDLVHGDANGGVQATLDAGHLTPATPSNPPPPPAADDDAGLGGSHQARH